MTKRGKKERKAKQKTLGDLDSPMRRLKAKRKKEGENMEERKEGRLHLLDVDNRRR